ncbi:MAG: hypothetical protein DWQ19_12690 [Crenarchaeota archaeon]|nr:MAG: hypothetical protein DWQ19_12690 [Thermoproteota archaeon]
MELELNFKEFLNEARRGPVPGAFGKQGRNRPRYNVTTQPLDDAGAYQVRISAGKNIEQQIREKLKEFNILTTPASSHQDKNLGIDAFITSTDGGTTKTSIPIQIKARKNASGNDILWEAVKPWNDNIVSSFEELGDRVFTGKDMKSKAKYLVSMSNDGNTIRLRSVEETIQMAKKMVEEFIHNYRATGRKVANTQYGQIRLVKDPSQEANYNLRGDVFKLNCFISPDVYSHKKDLTLQTPIGAV